jgi:hypothetical protein
VLGSCKLSAAGQERSALRTGGLPIDKGSSMLCAIVARKLASILHRMCRRDRLANPITLRLASFPAVHLRRVLLKPLLQTYSW